MSIIANFKKSNPESYRFRRYIPNPGTLEYIDKLIASGKEKSAEELILRYMPNPGVVAALRGGVEVKAEEVKATDITPEPIIPEIHVGTDMDGGVKGEPGPEGINLNPDSENPDPTEPVNEQGPDQTPINDAPDADQKPIDEAPTGEAPINDAPETQEPINDAPDTNEAPTETITEGAEQQEPTPTETSNETIEAPDEHPTEQTPAPKKGGRKKKEDAAK